MPTESLVFVVDDERGTADSFAAILRLVGFSAESFYDGETALQYAHKYPPTAVVSDIRMPVMDGFRLLKKMKKLCPTCKVVLISGNAGIVSAINEVRQSEPDV